jgi:mRNA interferase MazF
MYFKDFDTWNTTKKRIQGETRTINIREGEIRWVSMGVNVGSEIDGKGVSFTRPALIMHVIGSQLALVIPMSTKLNEIPGYLPFFFKDQWVSLCFNQLRVISQKRIYARIGKVSENKLVAYKIVLKKFFEL